MFSRSVTLLYDAGESHRVHSDAALEKGDEMTNDDGDTWIVQEASKGDDGETVVKLSPDTPDEWPSTETDDPA